ncbi:MAG: flagellar motor protein PomA [Pseudomonadota bacterium]
MDIATLIGLVGAAAVVAVTILLGGQPIVFVNVPSLVIVIAGTLMAVMIRFSLGQFLAATKVAVKAFSFKQETAEELIEKSVELATIARKDGILSLEEAEIDNPFMKQGIDLVIDGHDQEVVRAILTKDMVLAVARHDEGKRIYMAIGDTAPAMGMIGTLIGLVQMLSTLDDPKQIAPAMAVALLTTLYGAVIANMFAMPIADKLGLRSKEERRSKSLIIDAIAGIQDSQNPRVIESLLKNYLPTSKRDADAKEAA